MTKNIFLFVFNIWNNLVGFVEAIFGFLFQTVNLGIIEISVWELLGGAGIVVIIIAVIVKCVVPLT